MKRSSSKLISKAGSMRNINKAGFKFSVQLEIESVDKVFTTNDVCLTWERSHKIVSTPAVPVNRTTRVVSFKGEAITHEVTLFKRKRDDAPFDDKVYRLVARQSTPTGKVIGKIDLNISEHCTMSTSSKRVGAALSNGSRVVMSITTTFLHEAKTKRGGSKGSVGSSTVDDDMSLTSADDTAVLGDLDDLDVSDDGLDAPMPVVKAPSNSRAASNPSQQIGAASSVRRPAPRAIMAAPLQNGSDDDNTAAGGNMPSIQTMSLTSSVSTPVAGGGRNATPPSGPKVGRKPSRQQNTPSRDGPGAGGGSMAARKLRSRDDGGGSGGGDAQPELASLGSAARSGSGAGRGRPAAAAASAAAYAAASADSALRAEFDKMRKENRGLRRRNEDLESRVEDLDRQIDEYQHTENNQNIEELAAENKALRMTVEDLETKLKREPHYNDIVHDLRETKLALAIITLEKDELWQEIRHLRKLQ